MAASTLAQLREINPHRALTPGETKRIAEAQAARLLTIADVTSPAVPESVITQLPRVTVERMSMPVSGSSHWIAGRWILAVNANEAYVRNRWTLAHELKHVLDHPFIDRLYPDLFGMDSRRRAERACDYFAACLLIPRPMLKKIWGSGIQDVDALAEIFAVSGQAMGYRIQQLGLAEPTPRHDYHRASVSSYAEVA